MTSEIWQAASFRTLLTLLPEAALVIDAAGRIVEVNAAAARLCEVPEPMLRGAPLRDFLPLRDLHDATARFAQARSSGPLVWEARLDVSGGGERTVEFSVDAARVGDEVVAYVVIARGLPREHGAGADGSPEVLRDPLTGLANRTLFRQRVERALARFAQHVTSPAPAHATAPDAEAPSPAAPAAGRHGAAASRLPGEAPSPTSDILDDAAGHHVAVLFIDLDDFKTVNDSLGHAEGDRLLEEVGRRLLKATRGFDLVARLGGDEFGVLLEGMVRDTDATAVVDRIGTVLKRPILLHGREVVVSASVGVAHARDARSADEILRNADVAMYQAKASGKGRHAEFDRVMHTAALARLELASALQDVLLRDELVLEYQPVVELATGRLVGAEALVRWDRPGHGVLQPLAFIPMAEASGAIVPIGRWVLRTACLQLAEWRRAGAVDADFAMNVNVSGRQLVEPGFVDDVRAVLAETSVSADALTLEITESVVVQRVDEVLDVLRALRATSVRIAVDDFGTGYSSLGYLQRLPVDVLKIDRCFVEHVEDGGTDAAVARMIVALGEALGLEAVAEGVELQAQRDALTAMGCERAQGYLFARPVPPAEFVRRFAPHTSAA